MSPYAVHAQVLNLTRTATVASTTKYLKSHFEDSRPIIYDVIDDGNSRRAVVCFIFKSKRKAHKAISDLNRRRVPFVDDFACSSVPTIDFSCEGLLILKNDSHDPDFDVCFVHGLKGHALRTFSSSNDDHRQINTWPRDLLPGILDNSTRHGRYMTFGHDHDYLVGDRVVEPLDETAQNLLRTLTSVRGQTCNKPIFFVCHSLGGLIVCKAVLLALMQEHGQDRSFQSEIQGAFWSEGRTLIKGIFFFGTPFKGTNLARIGALLARRLGLAHFINTTTLSYLAIKNKEIKQTMDDFERAVEHNKIRLAIFYERLKFSKGPFKKVIVSRDSARGRFKDSVEKKGLARNHATLVKFTGPEDPIFKDQVAEIMKRTFESAMAPDSFRPMLYRRQDTQINRTGRAVSASILTALTSLVYDVPSESAGNPALWFNRPTGTLKDFYQSRIDNFWRELEKTLGRLRSLNNNPVQGTCEWILEHPRYQAWLDSANSEILFIQGGAGYGKSWLAEFLVKRLSAPVVPPNPELSAALQNGSANGILPPPRPKATYVAWYFASNREAQSPQRILLQIVAQIAERQAQKVLDAFIANIEEAIEGFTELLLWKILHYIRRSLDGELFCLVDGLDQCIDALRTREQPTVAPKMVKFIETLCKVGDRDLTAMKMNAKVLIFTRAKPEIRTAIANRDIVLEIEERLVLQPVRLMIEAELEQLARDNKIPDEYRAPVAEAMATRCGPIFLMAYRLLCSLKDNEAVRNSLDSILRFITSTSVQDIDEVNEKYLLGVMEENTMQKAIKLAKAVYFAAEPLTKPELLEVVAIDLAGRSTEHFKQNLQSNDLEVLLQKEFGYLFSINDKQEVGFDHFSVKTLLQGLPDDSTRPLSVFSCSNEQEGHAFMMRLCLQYLVSVGIQYTSDQDEATSIDREWNFLYYAIGYWAHHAELAKDALYNHLEDVQIWLSTPGVYYFTIRAEQFGNYEGNPENFTFEDIEPLDYFALKGLDILVMVMLLRWRPRRIARLLSPLGIRTRTANDFRRRINQKGLGGQTLFHHICRSGNLNLINYLIDHGADGSVQDDDGRSPLFIAVIAEHLRACALLAARNQFFDTRGHILGMSCLHMACYSNLIEIAALCILEGVDPNIRAYQGWTPLHTAAMMGFKRIFEMLLVKNASIDARRKNGANCLHISAENGHLPIVELILRNENYTEMVHSASLSGRTPLHCAAMKGHVEVFNRLHPFSPSCPPDNNGWLPIHYASANGHEAIVRSLRDSAQLRALTKRKENVLHLATRYGHIGLVEFFINELNFDPDQKCDELLLTSNSQIQDKTTLSPLFIACSGGHSEIAELLSTKAVNFEVQTTTGLNLLHVAVETASTRLALWLMQHDVDSGHLDTNENNILHRAAIGGHVAQLEAIQAGSYGFVPAIDGQNKEGMTALLFAASQAKWDFVEKLLELGADTVVSSGSGSTFLHYLAEHGRPMPPQLLADPANLRKQDEDGDTPLHKAASKGHTAAIEALADADADINALNKYNQTPIILAAYGRRTAAVKLLIRRNAEISTLDCFGRTALDVIRDFEDYKVALGNSAMIPPTPASQSKAAARTSMATFLRGLDNDINLKLGELWNVGNCCKILDLIPEAKFCFETVHALSKAYNRALFEDWTCDVCGEKDEEGPWRSCCRCLGTVICENCTDCVPDRRPAGCKLEHVYVSIGENDSTRLQRTPEELKQRFETWRVTMLTALDEQQASP